MAALQKQLDEIKQNTELQQRFLILVAEWSGLILLAQINSLFTLYEVELFGRRLDWTWLVRVRFVPIGLILVHHIWLVFRVLRTLRLRWNEPAWYVFFGLICTLLAGLYTIFQWYIGVI